MPQCSGWQDQLAAYEKAAEELAAKKAKWSLRWSYCREFLDSDCVRLVLPGWLKARSEGNV